MYPDFGLEEMGVADSPASQSSCIGASLKSEIISFNAVSCLRSLQPSSRTRAWAKSRAVVAVGFPCEKNDGRLFSPPIHLGHPRQFARPRPRRPFIAPSKLSYVHVTHLGRLVFRGLTCAARVTQNCVKVAASSVPRACTCTRLFMHKSMHTHVRACVRARGERRPFFPRREHACSDNRRTTRGW